MPDEQPLSPQDLSRQARQHLESLRAAGVEWLPNAPARSAVGRISNPSGPGADGLEIRPTTEAPVTSLPVLGETPAGKALTVEQRKAALAALAQRVAGCTRCAALASTRTQTVFGTGALDPELCFIGEAPGADEDRLGEPFVGAAGQLLNRIIAACGMKREEVYICNILRCRPPGNRTPLPDEAANCREYLDATLDLVRPKFICCLGACAAHNLLGIKIAVGKMRGHFYDYRGITVAVTYHPSYLLHSQPNPQRFEAEKRKVWEDMKMLLARMGKPIPGPKKQ
jgi:DNA polymerase